MKGNFMQTLSRRKFLQLLVAAGVVSTGTVSLSSCANDSQPATDSNQSTTDSNANTNATSEAPQAEVTTVIDAKGNEFAIPDTVDRIVITCNGGTTQEVAIFGGADKIVAQPSMEKFPQLMKMYPQFESVVNGGSFDDLNIEALVSTEPDVALVGVSSDKGNAQIADMGIPTYVMLIGWAAVDTLKQEFLNVGRIVNGEEGEAKAVELVDHWDKTFDLLNTRLAEIPESDRKTVYYLSKADVTSANTGDWGREWIAGSGGNFAVPETDLNGEITVEKALEWDPDVIVIQKGSDINELLNNEQVKDMQAIINQEVYSVPIGAFWWDRPCPEATLGFLWLAQTLYPDQFADIDLETETKQFFKDFYNYDLSTEEYQSFF